MGERTLVFAFCRPYNEHVGNLPNGTVTFLFTDIEGSTRLAQQYPDSITEILNRHHEILKTAIEGHGGYIFQIIGDAFCTAFQTARAALDAAIDAQHSLAAEPWVPGRVGVRMGIATGTARVEMREGRPPDYSGYLNLARVQRVMTAAYGGQILLSNASAELIRGELPRDVQLRDLGEHRLKGLANPEHLWQVAGPGLQADFPPLPSLDSIPNNLPLQLTSFVGREKELLHVGELLKMQRLVTLTGVGGTGKTRLALQVATEIIDEFQDGVWLVELATVSDAEQIPDAISAVVGVREQRGSTLLEVLKDFLARRRVLVVLDNCEHLLEGCARTADVLLHSAPQLRILATSREALGIAGESIVPVHSLSLPRVPAHTAEAISQYEAVRLFGERATAVQPEFNLTDQNAAAVAEICARLDGIPLAIELAAARVKGLSVEQIAARLHDRFRLLTGGSRTALPRQRTLQAAIDWSYKLLSEEERHMLRQLSVFSGGWTLEAAEAVCGASLHGADQALDVQMRLIGKSLVAADTQQSKPRYRMLETIRQYAQEKLDDAGEAAEARNRHLQFFLELAEQAEKWFLSKESSKWLRRMDEDRENLRAAMDHAIGSGRPEGALRLFGAAFWLWVWQASHSEGQKLAEAALAAAPATKSAARAKTLAGLGYCAHQQSDFRGAMQAWGEALPIWEELNDRWWQATLIGWYGNALVHEKLPGAFDRLQEALQIAREVNEPWALSMCLWLLGSNRSDRGDPDALTEGRRLLEESLAIIRRTGDPILLDEVLLDLGRVAEASQDYPRALSLYGEALEAARGSSDLIFETYFNLDLGRVLQIMGQNEQAEGLFAESLRRSIRIGKRSSLVQALSSLGVVAQARGDAERAVRLFSAGDSLFGGLGTKTGAAQREFRPWLEQHVSTARAELGEKRFAALSKEGQAMTLEQVIQYALEATQEHVSDSLP